MRRNALIEAIALKWLEHADQEQLEQLFYNTQVEYLEDLYDDELAEQAERSGIDPAAYNDEEE